jgi:hypothetical protein
MRVTMTMRKINLDFIKAVVIMEVLIWSIGQSKIRKKTISVKFSLNTL